MPARLSLSRLLLRFPYYDALYFSFIAGLTIGYGDIVVKIAAGRLIAILIGFAGVLFTGLVVAAAVQSIRKALHSSHTDRLPDGTDGAFPASPVFPLFGEL